MHSRLFQLEKSVNLPAEEVYFIEPYEISKVCDYFENTETWEEDLNWLDEVLPKECFTREGDTLTLVKPLEEYLEAFLDEVKLEFNLLTPKDLGGSNWYKAMRKAKTNNTDFRVYSGYFGCSVSFITWLMEEASKVKVGDTFKIISIIDYHF